MVPTPPFPEMVFPICQITNGGCRRKTQIVTVTVATMIIIMVQCYGLPHWNNVVYN
jgi:hypothetical protein